jgi:DNA mismatch repair protein MutL
MKMSLGASANLSSPQIRVLPEEISQKIAAGEVIERPFSVVKELVENSLDASASDIKVELKDGGKSQIKVTDNGRGMRRDDAQICFKRHSTSKISKESDLEKIDTLGFRGDGEDRHFGFPGRSTPQHFCGVEDNLEDNQPR